MVPERDMVVNQCIMKNIQKLKQNARRVDRHFYDNEMSKEDFHCICVTLVTFIDSVFKKGKNNCPQVFLGECKHIFKKENINKYISNDLESSFDGSNEENSNKEISYEENNTIKLTQIKLEQELSSLEKKVEDCWLEGFFF